jgi:hypothetical protein
MSYYDPWQKALDERMAKVLLQLAKQLTRHQFPTLLKQRKYNCDIKGDPSQRLKFPSLK